MTTTNSGDTVTTATSTLRAAPVAPTRGRLHPVPADDVALDGGFWGERQERNASASIAHATGWMERLGWISNFDRVAEAEEGIPAGREFADSEVYKLLEAMAWEIGRGHSAGLEAEFSALAARVVAAQQPDGYLNTRFGGPGQQPRYSDLEWGHELYCAGHLIQAGVARARTTGVDDFVLAVIRVADHICTEFGAEGRQSICGHPEIEAALVELSRLTGNPRYLEQARLFVERRGWGTLDGGETASDYFLDDVPVRDAAVLRGHAVRATYFAAGAVDVAVETGDESLLDAVATQWENTTARRTYLTGGMGSRHEGESFGEDFELPSDRAYSETCAGIGSIMLSWRLLLARGGARYADLIERTLFNVIATSPDAHGTAFFYVNPLQRNVLGTPAALEEPSPRASSSQRAPWFAVSCCPTNEARTFASLGAYIATVDEEGLQLHQYAPGDIRTTLVGGGTVALRVDTAYPLDGRIQLTVIEAPSSDWRLSLRIPAWAAGATVTGAGTVTIADGIAAIDGLAAGDRLELDLPIEPRFSIPDTRIDGIRGSIAVEAGPMVYCLESVDLPGVELSRVFIDPTTTPRRTTDDGVTVRATVRYADGDGPWPYGDEQPALPEEPRDVELIPYHRWAERGPSTMRVWLPADGRR
jgi:DUF1680 family protein